MRPIALVASLLFVALLAAPAAPAESRARAASFHACGDIPHLTTWDIRAKRVKCGKARRVIRAYVAAVGRNGGFTQNVLGFHCKISGYYGDGAYYRCASSGHRVVRFTRGG
ncbi:MAG TPA: hypothetical protein VGW80_00670 [Solirubrobacterales bacterium]|jgi:hypothetical protein|nr:hypothetical protein [Solirubrobacterales bacterium]